MDSNQKLGLAYLIALSVIFYLLKDWIHSLHLNTPVLVLIGIVLCTPFFVFYYRGRR